MGEVVAGAVDARSPLQKFVVFRLLKSVNRPDVHVGDLLHLTQRAAFVVFSKLMVLEQLLERVVRVTSNLADVVPTVLGELVNEP